MKKMYQMLILWMRSSTYESPRWLSTPKQERPQSDAMKHCFPESLPIIYSAEVLSYTSPELMLLRMFGICSLETEQLFKVYTDLANLTRITEPYHGNW